MAAESTTPGPEALLEHADWLRRLAHALVGDPAAAADLVQDTYEVALADPPRRDGPVRPWLGGVLRNLVRMRARAGARRDRRHTDAAAIAASEDVSAETLVERVQTQQLVARCVLELTEPFRQTLLLRYYEGLSAADIARRLGIPAGTVRWRLKHALDDVRASLDTAHGGDRRRWALVLAPLAGAPTTGGALTTLLHGGLLMKTGTKIAAVVAVLVALVIGARFAGFWGGGGKDQPAAATKPGAADAGAVPPRKVAGPPPAAPSDRIAGDDRDSAARDDDPLGPLRLEGQVIDASEQPVGGAQVAIDSNPPRVATSEADGSFVFTGLIARDYRLESHSGDGYAGPVQLRLAPDPEPVILRMRPAGILRIHVTELGTDAPIAGAEVELRSLLTWTATTGADGVAELRGVGPGWTPLHARAPGFAPTALRLVATGDPAVPQRQVITLSRGAAAGGRVVDVAGKAVAGARVLAAATWQPFPVVDVRRDAIVTGADGSFRFPALAAGSYRFTASHDRYAPSTTPPISVDGARPRTDVEIVVDAGAVVAGIVLGGDGKPRAAADVRVVGRGSVSWRLTRQAFTDAKGRFRIVGLPRRAVDVVANHATGGSALMPLDLVAKADHQIELVIDVTGEIAGVVVDSAGEGVADAQLLAEPVWTGDIGERNAWGVRGIQAVLADASGHFRFAGLPEGKYEVHVAHPGAPEAALWLSRGIPAKAGDRDLKLVLPADGKVVGRVVLADGTPPAAFTVAIGAAHPVPFASEDGRFELTAPGGVHSVEIAGGMFLRKAVHDVEIEDGKTADLGTITVEAGRSISGRVLDPDGAPVAGAKVAAGRLISGSGAELNIPDEGFDVQETETNDDGRFAMNGFGSFPVTVVAGRDGVGRSTSVQIPRGNRSVVLDLVLAATGGLEGKVTGAGGAPITDTVMIANPVGATRSNFFVITGPDGSFAFDMLTAGEYIVYPMVGGGGRMPKDLYIRVVQVEAGVRGRADIDAAPGPATVEVVVKVDDGTPIPQASVVLIGAEVDAPTMESLRDATWLARELKTGGTTQLHFRQAIDGATATFEGVVPRVYSVCATPIPPGAAMDDIEGLPMKCTRAEVTAAGAAQPVEITVPLAWTKDP